MALSDHDMLAGYEPGSSSSKNSESDRTLTLALPSPITAGETRLSQITVREPTLYETIMAAKKVRSFPDISPVEVMEAEMELVRQVSGLSETVFLQLPADTLRQARDFVVGFEERAREEMADGDDHPPADKILHFSPAITGNDQSWDSMTLHAPTVGQIRPAKALLKKPSLETILRSDELLIEAVSGWPKAAVLRLPVSSFVEAAGYLNAFFPAGR